MHSAEYETRWGKTDGRVSVVLLTRLARRLAGVRIQMDMSCDATHCEIPHGMNDACHDTLAPR